MREREGYTKLEEVQSEIGAMKEVFDVAWVDATRQKNMLGWLLRQAERLAELEEFMKEEELQLSPEIGTNYNAGRRFELRRVKEVLDKHIEAAP